MAECYLLKRVDNLDHNNNLENFLQLKYKDPSASPSFLQLSQCHLQSRRLPIRLRPMGRAPRQDRHSDLSPVSLRVFDYEHFRKNGIPMRRTSLRCLRFLQVPYLPGRWLVRCITLRHRRVGCTFRFLRCSTFWNTS